MKDITRILVETTLRKTLKDIKDSPKRSIRNLVDLGLNFAKGRFQKPFLETVQKMLENEHSPYYDLISDIVYNVNHERLITFGMNVGYNGCTKGAKKIREIENTEKYNIPWSVSLEIDGNSYLDNENKYFSIIEQGKNLGIYTWLIFSDSNVKSILSLAKKHTDCAFAFFCDEKDIEDNILDEAEKLYNIMFVIRYNEDMMNTVSLLREKQMLYSIYIPYTENNVNSITSGDYFEGIEDLHPVFTALLPVRNCKKSVREQAYNYVTESRKNQELQTIMWDIYSDSNFIDGIISDNACAAAFDKAGEFVDFDRENEDTNYNIFNNELTEIFKNVFPKKQ